MSQSEEQELVYEQDEVLWAKIRGYPWWPAFVDKIHDVNDEGQTQYTVFFFGDNTHSRLGTSKLRKFIDNYTEFFPKAKSHRKLMMSIQKAEEKLQQNDQNVEIFEQMRETLRLKKNKSKGGNLGQSKVSSSDNNLIQDIPDLIKTKNRTKNKNNIKIFQEEESSSSKQEPIQQQPIKAAKSDQNICDEDPISEIKPEKRLGKRRLSNPLPEIKPEPLLEKRISKKSKIQQIFEEESRQNIPSIPVQKSAIDEEQKLKQKSQSLQNEAMEAESSESEQENDQKSYLQGVVSDRSRTNKRRKSGENKAPRKRGRPKKSYTDDDQIVPISTKLKPISKLEKKKSFRGVVRPQPKRSPSKKSSNSNNEILNHLRSLLHSREQLIDYLLAIEINTNNIKQILDLDVSNILQEGQITDEITELLEFMRAALLYKYFPEDLKNKKKFEKLNKKKQNYHKIQDKEEQEEQQVQCGIQELEIRKKTIVKLQKFLKQHAEVQSKAKEMAVKIESYFQKADNGIGERYKSIALKVLGNLKEKRQSFGQIMKNLDTRAYE